MKLNLESLELQELYVLRKQIENQIKVKRGIKKAPELVEPLRVPGGRRRNFRLYVLLLQHSKYYVGMTAQKVTSRYGQHELGIGAKWTRQHPPIGILETIELGFMSESEACALETKKTLELIREHGELCVRGGKFCFVDDRLQERALNRYYRKQNRILKRKAVVKAKRFIEVV